MGCNSSTNHKNFYMFISGHQNGLPQLISKHYINVAMCAIRIRNSCMSFAHVCWEELNVTTIPYRTIRACCLCRRTNATRHASHSPSHAGAGTCLPMPWSLAWKPGRDTVDRCWRWGHQILQQAHTSVVSLLSATQHCNIASLGLKEIYG